MKKRLVVILACFALIAACKKNELGGKSTIRGRVSHHDKAIANATVYIKFDAEDSPGTDLSKYDAHVKADVGGDYREAGGLGAACGRAATPTRSLCRWTDPLPTAHTDA